MLFKKLIEVNEADKIQQNRSSFNTVKSNSVSFQFFINDIFWVNLDKIIFRDSVTRLKQA